MTVSAKVHLQNSGADADEVRRLIATLTADAEGVFAAGDLEVTEKSGTPDMSVDVAAGRALVLGTEAALQGTYFTENDGPVNLAIAAADASNPRKDLVIVRVQDAVYSGAVNDITVEIVTGTPAASPTEPAVPANSYVLALVDVPALDTSIEDAQITDRRSEFNPLSDGVVTNAKAGFAAGAASALTVTQGATLTMSSELVRHLDLGKVSIMFGYLVFDSAGTASNKLLITLPAGLTGSAAYAQGSAHFNDDDGGAYALQIRGESAANDTIRFQGDDASGNGHLGTDIAVTVASGDTLNFFVIWRNG